LNIEEEEEEEEEKKVSNTFKDSKIKENGIWGKIDKISKKFVKISITAGAS
jgi:hypothetical protein